MSARKLLKLYAVMNRDIKDVLIEVDFEPEPGCHGGCGTYHLIVDYPVANGNCTLDSPIVYTYVSDIEPSYCCSGYNGTIADVKVDFEVPPSMLEEAITVRQFIMEHGSEDIFLKIQDQNVKKAFKMAIDAFNAGNSSMPGTMVWAQGKGNFHRNKKTKPWKTVEECQNADFEGIDREGEYLAQYSKNHLYFMAEAMGIKVDRGMSKSELCRAIVHS